MYIVMTYFSFQLFINLEKMMLKLVQLILVSLLAFEVSPSPTRSRAVVPSKSANHISPNRSGNQSKCFFFLDFW